MGSGGGVGNLGVREELSEDRAGKSHSRAQNPRQANPRVAIACALGAGRHSRFVGDGKR